MIARGAPYSPIGHVSTLWIGAALLIPTFAILAFIALQPWIPVAYLVRDPLVVAMQAAECCSSYYGAFFADGVASGVVNPIWASFCGTRRAQSV